VLEPGPRPPATQTVSGYQLPTRIGPAFECGTNGASEARRRLQVEIITCSARVGLLVQPDLEVGSVQFQHRVVRSQGLQPLQFAQRLNGMVAEYRRSGSGRDVAAYACRNELVALDGFDARVMICARQYRLFSALYDLAVTVTSINSTDQAVITQLDLGGVGFEPGMQFVRRFMGLMQWKP
jgi:hypothetical protein